MVIEWSLGASSQQPGYQGSGGTWLSGEGGASPDQPIALWDIAAPQWTIITYLTAQGGLAPPGASRRFYWLGHPPH